MKLPQASRYVPLSPPKFCPSALVVVPLLSTMLTLGSSSRGSNLIICTLWVIVGCVALFPESALSVKDSLAAHDQISHNSCMKLWLGWYNLMHNVLVLHSCSRLAARDPFLVPFHLVLDHTLRTHCVQSSRPDPDFTPSSAFYKQMTDPSTFDSYDNPFLHHPLIYKSCKRAVGGSSCILVIDDSYQCCAFLPPDRLRTRAG